MSKKHKEIIAQLPQNPEYKPELQAPDAPKPTAWIVLEDRRICARGAITQLKQGKIIKDEELAQMALAQGVKIQPYAA